LKYFTECEDLAAKLANEDFTPESLAVLSHLLEQLSPIPEKLTTASLKSDPPIELELEEIKDTWRRCPFPIRRFVFEKGLFNNTVRKHATSPDLRWGLDALSAMRITPRGLRLRRFSPGCVPTMTSSSRGCS